MNWLKKYYKAVLLIMGALITFWTFTAHFASSEDLKKVETNTSAAIVEMKKSMELDRDLNRLNTVNDSLMKARIQQRTYPKDKDIKEDVESLKSEKEKIQQRIEKR
jgi:hypothetical protein